MAILLEHLAKCQKVQSIKVWDLCGMKKESVPGMGM